MTVRLLTGDCRGMLTTLPDASVQCCVTSPPYFQLRDYGVVGQIGLEETLEEYVDTLVSVFSEVRRVLRDDGVLFLNLGDSYAGSWGAQSRGDFTPGTLEGASTSLVSARQIHAHPKGTRTGMIRGAGMKPKDLMGVPWMVAFALQADGWYLRSDIIWSKPNPMPESVRDRPTKSHEYIFLMSKSARYFFDAEAVKESAEIHAGNAGTFKRNGSKREAPIIGQGYGTHRPNRDDSEQNGSRNIRSVWTIATAPFAEAHFATFPPDLAERCIKAGTSEKGACAACGAPWVRVVEKGALVSSDGRSGSCGVADQAGVGNSVSRTKEMLGRDASYYGMAKREKATTGWQPSCPCDADVVPCVVLDPFSGSGTVSLVAERLGRDSIGIELSETYIDLAADRIRRDCPMFSHVAIERPGTPPGSEGSPSTPLLSGTSGTEK